MITYEVLHWQAVGVLVVIGSGLTSLGLLFGKNTQRIAAIEDTLENDIKPRFIRLEKRIDQMYEILLTLKK